MSEMIQVRATRRIHAPAETAFDAWLDPKQAGKFLFATPTGTMVRAEVDARIGGAFHFTDRRDGVDVAHVGEYLEIDRPRRLVFTFRVEVYSADSSRVAVDIVPVEGGCEVTLTHEMDSAYAEYEEGARAAWAGILDGLAATVA